VQYSLLHTYAIRYSLLLLGYKPVQHVTVLNNVGNCNTVVSIIMLYCNMMGPMSYMRSVVDRNVVTRCMTIQYKPSSETSSSRLISVGTQYFCVPLHNIGNAAKDIHPYLEVRSCGM